MKNNSYDDIINLPHPVSKNHPQMPLRDRAAQFAPFAALTGHDAAIKETARLTDERLELSEEVIAQLNEKIDIIRWSNQPEEYIASALSPAKVISVSIVDENEKQAVVVVPDNQLSLAIGKEGQNARLAAKLTGWKIDIKSELQV